MWIKTDDGKLYNTDKFALINYLPDADGRYTVFGQTSFDTNYNHRIKQVDTPEEAQKVIDNLLKQLSR